MKKNSKNLDFLLEVFTEEIPARLVNELGAQLERNFLDELDKNSINYSDIKAYYTPRRLVVFIKGLASKQEDYQKFLLGPPKKIAMNEKGELLKPALAFLEKNRIKAKQLKITNKDGKEFISVDKKVKGINTKDFLANTIVGSIKSIKNKKFMRWGQGNIEFIRPIRNIFALFGKNPIKIRMEGINNEDRKSVV